MKKMISFICIFTVLSSVLFTGVSVKAKESLTNILVMSNKGDTVEHVLIDGSDIYVTAEFINQYTAYKATEYNNGIRFTRGAKYINAKYDGTTSICNVPASFKLGNVKQLDNRNYYSLSHVLPMLNCYPAVDGGKLMIANNSISIWELINTFNPDEIKFDLKTEYAKNNQSDSNLLNGFSFQKMNYLKSNFKLMWTDAALYDMIATLADYDVFYDIYADLMNDYDFTYQVGDHLKNANGVSSVFDALNMTESPVISRAFGVSGAKSEYVRAYLQSNADKLSVIKHVGRVFGELDDQSNTSRRAAFDIAAKFSDYADISSKLVSYASQKSTYISAAVSNSPEKSTKPTYKEEISRLSVYAVLSDAGKYKFSSLASVCGTSGASAEEARLAAIQYLYFSKKSFEAMQLYYIHYKQPDIADTYCDKIDLCNSWLSKFVAAGVGEVQEVSYSDLQDILATVSITYEEPKIQSENEKQAAAQLLSVFRESCFALNSHQLIFIGDAATKGQIGALIYCILSNKDYFGLSSSKLEVVKTNETQFNKIYDAVNNAYKETDVERYPSSEIILILKEKFGVDVVLNNYDVYQYIYYEEGYFYNYLDAYNCSDTSTVLTCTVRDITPIKDGVSVVRFENKWYNKEKDKTRIVKGYAVMDIQAKAVFEYNETVSSISKTRLQRYQ